MCRDHLPTMSHCKYLKRVCIIWAYSRRFQFRILFSGFNFEYYFHWGASNQIKSDHLIQLLDFHSPINYIYNAMPLLIGYFCIIKREYPTAQENKRIKVYLFTKVIFYYFILLLLFFFLSGFFNIKRKSTNVCSFCFCIANNSFGSRAVDTEVLLRILEDNKTANRRLVHQT